MSLGNLVSFCDNSYTGSWQEAELSQQSGKQMDASMRHRSESSTIITCHFFLGAVISIFPPLGVHGLASHNSALDSFSSDVRTSYLFFSWTAAGWGVVLPASTFLSIFSFCIFQCPLWQSLFYDAGGLHALSGWKSHAWGWSWVYPSTSNAPLPDFWENPSRGIFHTASTPTPGCPWQGYADYNPCTIRTWMEASVVNVCTWAMPKWMQAEEELTVGMTRVGTWQGFWECTFFWPFCWYCF